MLHHLDIVAASKIRAHCIIAATKDKPWFNDDCRLEFDLMQAANLRWTRDSSRVNWDEFVNC